MKHWVFGLSLIPLIAGILLGHSDSGGQTGGQEIYRSACVACHGTDGRGASDGTRGFEKPATFPDFTECAATSREPDVSWSAIIHNGGPDRGFSEIMPSFREALPDELTAAAQRTKAHLQSETARISIGKLEERGGRLEMEVTVENLGGHKLPTAYPSRRVWLHLAVRDRNNRAIFESGAVNSAGAIVDNDNDADAARFEPHYTEIRSAGQVQIYEAIMADSNGGVTTGLLNAVRYLKDNRLLPRGFDKRTADMDIAVAGEALEDGNFSGGGDRIRYSIELGEAQRPFQVEAELCYQPVGYRWAMNLRRYEAEEPRRFTRYYEAVAPSSVVVLAHAHKE